MAKRAKRKALVKTTRSSPAGFDEVIGLINADRSRAVAAVNTALMDLYWSIGEHISRREATAPWPVGAHEVGVAELAHRGGAMLLAP